MDNDNDNDQLFNNDNFVMSTHSRDSRDSKDSRDSRHSRQLIDNIGRINTNVYNKSRDIQMYLNLYEIKSRNRHNINSNMSWIPPSSINSYSFKKLHKFEWIVKNNEIDTFASLYYDKRREQLIALCACKR